MALTDQQENFTSRLMNWAEQQRLLQDEGRRLYEDYNNQGHSAIQDADLAASASFKHLTNAKLVAAINAQQAVETALGDGVTGQRINLVNMRG